MPRRRNIEVLLYVFKFAPGIFRAAATLRSRIVAELRYLPTSRAPVAIALSRLPSFAGHPRPLRPSPLPCFGTRLPGRIRIRLLLCTSSGSIFEKKTWGFICLLAAKFNQIIQQSTYGQEKKKKYCPYSRSTIAPVFRPVLNTLLILRALTSILPVLKKKSTYSPCRIEIGVLLCTYSSGI